MSPFFGYLTAWSTGLCGWRWGSQKSPPLAFMSVLVPGDGAVDTRIDRGGAGALANLAAVRLYGEIEFWFAISKSPRLS